MYPISNAHSIFCAINACNANKLLMLLSTPLLKLFYGLMTLRPQYCDKDVKSHTLPLFS